MVMVVMMMMVMMMMVMVMVMIMTWNRVMNRQRQIDSPWRFNQ